MTTLAVLICAAAFTAEPFPLHFERQRIGDITYEAASVFDVDKDGNLDIVSGGRWFPGPEFKEGIKIADVPEVDTYYDDFSSYPIDVNGDGYLDVVTGGWWNQTMCWRENPKGQRTEWVTHEVAKVGNIERNVFADLDGDGYVEVISTNSPVHFFKLERGFMGKGKGVWTQYTIDPGPGGHGLGAGDVNGDGRVDMLFSGGWIEAPEDPFNTAAWTLHQEWDFGMASLPILVHDVNGDQLNDIIVGQAHNYGLDWYAQAKDAQGQRTWTRHAIEPDRSQFHDIQLIDIDNDGAVELLTGKRYHANNGHDPGAEDPVGLYYYEINGGDFARVTIDFGPAAAHSGAGIYFWVEDIDGNNWKDIVAPGKEGVYLFKNFGPVKGG